MSCRTLLLLCAALAVSGAANPRQLDAVRHFLQRHHRQAAVPPPRVLRTFIEPKQPQQEPKEQEQLAPQDPAPTPSPWFDCPTEFGLFPDPYDCASYFQCSYGNAFVEECGPGLLYNPVTSTCDWPANIDPPCQAIPYPTAAGSQPAENHRQQQSGEQLKDQKAALQDPAPTPSPYFDCPTEFGLFPDPYDCASYFQCSYGNAFVEECGPGLLYNPVTSTCDWPANIDPPCQAIPYPTA